MSVVYKAKQNTLDRLVAVKILSLSNLKESNLKRFQQEAQLTSKLDHPNICKTLGFGFSKDGRPYILLEYLEGTTLAELLKLEAPLKFSRFKEIFIPILKALQYSHGQGLIHRDIKPGNIMISKSPSAADAEEIKLMDFGIAKVVEADKEQRLTQTGALIGSPAYMSPEQCLNAELDIRSDIYSLACVMYESLCGQPPFTANSALELMSLHTTSKLPNTKELCRQMELPEAMGKELLRALSKSPDKRPQSAQEFSQRLCKALDEVTIDRAPRQKKSGIHSHSFLAVSLILILLCAGIMIAVYFQLVPSKNKQHVTMVETESGTALFHQGREYENARENQAALESYQKAIPLLRKQSRTKRSDLINALAGVSRLLEAVATENEQKGLKAESIKNLESVLKYTNESLELTETGGDAPFFDSFCANKIRVLSKLNRRSEGFDFAMETLKKRKFTDTVPRLKFRQEICVALANQLYTKEAIEIALESQRIVKDDTTGFEEGEGVRLCIPATLVRLYREDGKRKQAIEKATKLKKQLLELHDPELTILGRTEVLRILFHELLILDKSDAVKFINKMSNETITPQDEEAEPYFCSHLYYMIASTFISSGEYKVAMNYYQRAFKLMNNAIKLGDRQITRNEPLCMYANMISAADQAKDPNLEKYKTTYRELEQTLKRETLK